MALKIKLKDITKEQYVELKDAYCKGRSCNDCIFNYVNCAHNAIYCWVINKDKLSDKFLNEEIEFSIPEKGRKILELIPEEFRYIVRDGNGNLCVYANKPFKGVNTWGSDGSSWEFLCVFNHDFKYIKWDNKEPTLIEDLLS